MRQCAGDQKIRDLDSSVIGKVFSDLVNEITLITGLKVEEQHAKPFAKLFSRFLISHYAMISPSEVTLAFRLNASNDLPEKVEFFGTALTIEHLGRVLFQYIRKRGLLSKKLSEQREAEERPAPTAEEIEEQDKEFVNGFYQSYLDGQLTNVSWEYAYLVYDSLDKRGLITLSNSQKNAYMKEVQAFRDRELCLPAVGRDERKEQNRLIEVYLNEALPAEEIERVKRYAKRLVLSDMFKSWKQEGKKQII